MGYRSNLVDIDVVLRRETDKAWGIVDPQGGADLVWIPKAWGELEGGDPPSCRGVSGPKFMDAARVAERIAWDALNLAVQRDLRDGRYISHKIAPPASSATLAAGGAWFRAYRERELHEGRSNAR